MITQDKIVKQVINLLAHGSAETVSMRKLAQHVGIAPSVIYHYFPTKHNLLRSVYEHNNRTLGEKRANLPDVTTARKMLQDRIEFQFDNAEMIVGVLKFYLAYRNEFPEHAKGYLPDKTYLHILEVLQFGVLTGEIKDTELEGQSRVIVHAINGYLLEYFPHIPSGKKREKVVLELLDFLWRGIIKK